MHIYSKAKRQAYKYRYMRLGYTQPLQQSLSETGCLPQVTTGLQQWLEEQTPTKKKLPWLFKQQLTASDEWELIRLCLFSDL